MSEMLPWTTGHRTGAQNGPRRVLAVVREARQSKFGRFLHGCQLGVGTEPIPVSARLGTDRIEESIVSADPLSNPDGRTVAVQFGLLASDRFQEWKRVLDARLWCPTWTLEFIGGHKARLGPDETAAS